MGRVEDDMNESTNPWQASGDQGPQQEKREVSPWWGITAGLVLICGAGYAIIKLGEHAEKESLGRY